LSTIRWVDSASKKREMVGVKLLLLGEKGLQNESGNTGQNKP